MEALGLIIPCSIFLKTIRRRAGNASMALSEDGCAVRKVMLVSDAAYDEVIVFGDAAARDRFIVQTWHRTARVAGIDGDSALLCIPAQLTIPLLVRWMLVLEDSDEEKLYLGKGLPREWLMSGKELRIDGAPTRWGRVSLNIAANLAKKHLAATVELAEAGSPKEVHLKLRVPKSNLLRNITVNGSPAKLGGMHADIVIIPAVGEKHFNVVAEF